MSLFKNLVKTSSIETTQNRLIEIQLQYPNALFVMPIEDLFLLQGTVTVAVGTVTFGELTVDSVVNVKRQKKTDLPAVIMEVKGYRKNRNPIKRGRKAMVVLSAPINELSAGDVVVGVQQST